MGNKVLWQKDKLVAKVKEVLQGVVALGIVFIPMGIEGAISLGQVSLLVGTIRIVVVLAVLVVLGCWSGVFR